MGLQYVLRIFGKNLSEAPVVRLAHDGLSGICSEPEVAFWEVVTASGGWLTDSQPFFQLLIPSKKIDS
jgi:hypothetical protein